jgi:cell division septal protein FtsQ
MKKQKIKSAVKIPGTIFVILAIAVLFTGYIWHSLQRLDYFRISEVVAGQAVKVDLSHLKGHNIFAVDLRAQARHLSVLYPEFRKIRLVRILPNRLFVDFIKRQPVACVRLYKNFSVDEECVLFEAPAPTQMPELPVIVGLETRILGPKPGKKFDIKELRLALDIIKEVRGHRALAYWRLRQIDLTNPAAASFIIALPFKKSPPAPARSSAGADQFEVKVGEYDTADKIGMLTDLLIQLKNDWITIKYIDLRFKEPVVKFKDAGAKK